MTLQGALMQELAVSEDDRQQIVEVVSHPSREAADRFQLLYLAKLLFQMLALDRVPEGANQDFRAQISLAQKVLRAAADSPSRGFLIVEAS